MSCCALTWRQEVEEVHRRYEIGRHDAASWRQWNENLVRIASNPRNTVAANNLYDLVRLV